MTTAKGKEQGAGGEFIQQLNLIISGKSLTFTHFLLNLYYML